MRVGTQLSSQMLMYDIIQTLSSSPKHIPVSTVQTRLKFLLSFTAPLPECPHYRLTQLEFLPVCRNQVDHGVVRVAQCGAGDGVIGSLDGGVTVIQNIPLSGGAFNKLFVFWEFVAEVAFVKVTKNNN